MMVTLTLEIVYVILFCISSHIHVSSVAQLSPTNTRDALHHGKRQNF